MMSDLASAVVAVGGAITAAYLTQFLAEDFRRFRDGSVLAAGLAGELNSYGDSVPLLTAMLQTWINMVKSDLKHMIVLRPFERATDMIYPQSVGKLGLLGAALVEDVVFVYSNLAGFRMSLELITTHHADMSKAEFQARCEACLAALTRAHDRGVPVVRALQERSQDHFGKDAWYRLLGLR